MHIYIYIFVEVQLYATHLPKGYFHTKNEVRLVKILCMKINLHIYIKKKRKINLHIYHIQRRPEHEVLSHYVELFSNNPNFAIFIKSWNVTHLLKLVDKNCKYEMDPASIVEDTEWTQFGWQTDGRTVWNQYTPLNFVGWGYNKLLHYWYQPLGPAQYEGISVQVRSAGRQLAPDAMMSSTLNKRAPRWPHDWL